MADSPPAPHRTSTVALRDDAPVGFLMVEDKPEEAPDYLWRFTIDGRYQGLPGDGGPGPFYERIGFRYTGELDEGELVMVRPLD